MRKLQPMPEGQGEQQARPTLRTDKPTAAYARRSPSYAKAEKKDKTQSREMQTEDIKIWALEQGWKEKHFHPYFSDFGLSGALRPDQRPDMLRLFDNIDEGKFDRGSVICYQESRLFRDETQIYYNQFIEKCKQHEMYYVRGVGYKRVWTEEEDAEVQEHYATLPRKELMALLPDRDGSQSWNTAASSNSAGRIWQKIRSLAQRGFLIQTWSLCAARDGTITPDAPLGGGCIYYYPGRSGYYSWA